MKKKFPCIALLVFSAGAVFSQSTDFSEEVNSLDEEKSVESEFSSDFFSGTDDGIFGFSDEDFFGSADDEFFEDDVIEELKPLDDKASALAKGTLFEIGSVRVGGSISTTLALSTPLYRNDSKNFGERLLDSRIKPDAGATLYIDARPTSTLRLYTKFGISYPYKDTVAFSMNGNQSVDPDSIDTSSADPDTIDRITDWLNGAGVTDMGSLFSFGTPSFSIANWLYLKELFTDFSIADRAFFRFGLHTVSWGAGFFFSPVSDMINTSSIDPEHTDAQVDGSVNLRTQITFPDSQNCLWVYIVPPTASSMPSISTQEELDNASMDEYLDDAMFPYVLKETALAAKMDVVISNWELGFGGIFKYNSAPKLMATASGSIINGKVGVFGEAVLSYGSQAQWNESSEWTSKDLIFQGTVGAMYMWSDPQITLMAQYYFDGNKDDHEYSTYGNNLAATVNYANIGGSEINATLFCLFYLGKTNVSTLSEAMSRLSSGSAFMPYAGIISANVSWSPVSALSISAGPYITWLDMTKAPDVSLRFSITLGGGKF